MGKLNVIEGKVVKDKKQYKDVNKKLADNNDDNEFATGFKDYSFETKLSSDSSKGSFVTESTNTWKDQKLSEFEDLLMDKLPQVGDLIERAGAVIQDFGKMVYDFGDRVEHFKREERTKTMSSDSRNTSHH